METGSDKWSPEKSNRPRGVKKIKTVQYLKRKQVKGRPTTSDEILMGRLSSTEELVTGRSAASEELVTGRPAIQNLASWRSTMQNLVFLAELNLVVWQRPAKLNLVVWRRLAEINLVVW